MSDVNEFLTELGENARGSLTTPVEIREVTAFPAEDEIKSEKIWLKIPKVVAVSADLKNSTALNFRKHPQTSAQLYEAVMSNCVRITNRFEPEFTDIQGDGLFALYHGDRAYERALCAAITLKTFSSRELVPAVEGWASDRFPDTGLKIGMAAGVLVVKKVGVRGTKEPVWAGKPVNWATKCAGAAGASELIVTEAVYGHFEDNDYVTHSCGCPNGSTPYPIWTDKIVDKLPEDKMRCKQLLSQWCASCGAEFCEAILAGKKDRDEVGGFGALAA
jgi:class 3 adenylate cyclase